MEALRIAALYREPWSCWEKNEKKQSLRSIPSQISSNRIELLLFRKRNTYRCPFTYLTFDMY